jgi:hypothetical protein
MQYLSALSAVSTALRHQTGNELWHCLVPVHFILPDFLHVSITFYLWVLNIFRVCRHMILTIATAGFLVKTPVFSSMMLATQDTACPRRCSRQEKEDKC